MKIHCLLPIVLPILAFSYTGQANLPSNVTLNQRSSAIEQSTNHIVDFSYRHGISKFERFRIEDYPCFVDKTSFIVNALNPLTCSQSDLLLRARRWGKTFNLDTLCTYLDIIHDENGKILHWPQREVYFRGGILQRGNKSIHLKPLKVSQHPDIMEHMGRHPVIFLSFIDCGLSYDNFLDCLRENIAKIIIEKSYANFLIRHCKHAKTGISFAECKHFLESPEKALKDTQILQDSLHILKHLLHAQFRENVAIIVDEYDFPIHDMVDNGRDLHATLLFLRSFFSISFKQDRKYIFKIIVAGLLLISKGKFSSEWNVLQPATIFHWKYCTDFGFTRNEVQDLLERIECNASMENMDNWYGGFYIHDVKMFNPLSICSSLGQEGRYVTSWSESGPSPKKYLSNAILSDKHQRSVQKLLCRYTLEGRMITDIDFKPILDDNEFVSALAQLGYLSAAPKHIGVGKKIYSVFIPNREMRDYFQRNIKKWFRKKYRNNPRIIFSEFNDNKNVAIVHKIINKFMLEELAKFNIYHCDSIFAALLMSNGNWIMNRTFTPLQTEPLDCVISLSPIDKSGEEKPLYIAIKYINVNEDSIGKTNWLTELRHSARKYFINSIKSLVQHSKFYLEKLKAENEHLKPIITAFTDSLPTIILEQLNGYTSPSTNFTNTRGKSSTRQWRVFAEVYYYDNDNTTSTTSTTYATKKNQKRYLFTAVFFHQKREKHQPHSPRYFHQTQFMVSILLMMATNLPYLLFSDDDARKPFDVQGV